MKAEPYKAEIYAFASAAHNHSLTKANKVGVSFPPPGSNCCQRSGHSHAMISLNLQSQFEGRVEGNEEDNGVAVIFD